ncbi:MAG TPA: hypothetical protein VNZ52_15305 [Candidatus Thermoplasmatota archaeon]|nr:hypothetical protein [Candidatus Thermoplasmatota archaeon]
MARSAAGIRRASRFSGLLALALVGQAYLLYRAAETNPYLELGAVAYVLVAVVVLAGALLAALTAAALSRRVRFARAAGFVVGPLGFLLLAAGGWLIVDLPGGADAGMLGAQALTALVGALSGVLMLARLR